MTAFFSRERFGLPQLYAGLLLLALAVQCFWVICNAPLGTGETAQLQRGLAQWRNGWVTPGPESPLVALMASVGIAVLGSLAQGLPDWALALLVRFPFLVIMLLRGASLWYVTRRLYGNPGGYVALALYCFSPAIVVSGAFVNGSGPSAWGFFGGIFSAIALSHTVYALGESPAEQVLGFRQWRWRRVALLGVAFGIAVGGHFVAAIVILLAAIFMFYLAPGRRTACFAIIVVACAIGLTIVLATYFFHLPEFAAEITNSLPPLHQDNGWASRQLAPLALVLQRSPALLLLFLVAFITYWLWRRARYFGNTAPLLVLAVLLLASPLAPQIAAFEQPFIVFAFVFIAGITADLLETSRKKLVLNVLFTVLLLHVLWGLSRLPMGAKAHVQAVNSESQGLLQLSLA